MIEMDGHYHPLSGLERGYVYISGPVDVEAVSTVEACLDPVWWSGF